MGKKEQIILKRALQELLECEVGVVPPDAEIQKKHSFSESFLERMNQLIRQQEATKKSTTKRNALEEKQSGKSEMSFWKKNRRVIAACIACVLVAGAGAAILQSGILGSKDGGASGEAADAGDMAIPEEGAGETTEVSEESVQTQDTDDLMDGDQAVRFAFSSEVTACSEDEVTILLTSQEEENLTLRLLSIRKTDGEETVVYEDAHTDMCYLVEANASAEVTFDRFSYGMEEAGTYVFEWVTSDEVTYLENYELD